MDITIPAYLEIERDVFKFAVECTYGEFIAALMRERDPQREAEMNRFLGSNLTRWRACPQMTLGAMFKIS